jgi:hypothetical protein
VASIASALGSASGGQNQQLGYGLGSKIFGAPGDPAGAIYQLVQGRLATEESKRRFNEQMALEKERLDLERKRQNQENAFQTRGMNMNALQMLANQRAQAIQSFKGQGFRDSLYRVIGG